VEIGVSVDASLAFRRNAFDRFSFSLDFMQGRDDNDWEAEKGGGRRQQEHTSRC
jgi:hypothetical protein